MQSVTPRKLPVFLFPQSLSFYIDDQTTHKQILTLYNPYDFPVKFRVFCTAPSKYGVGDPEGTIKARCCVDILVRHKAISLSNCDIIDKFRIHMQEHPTKQIIGKRDVEAQLFSGTPDPPERDTPDPDIFQQLPMSTGQNPQSYGVINHSNTIRRDTNYVALVAALICIAGLLLPTQGDQHNQIPDCLHLSVNAKLVLTFVLDIMLVMRILSLISFISDLSTHLLGYAHK